MSFIHKTSIFHNLNLNILIMTLFRTCLGSVRSFLDRSRNSSVFFETGLKRSLPVFFGTGLFSVQSHNRPVRSRSFFRTGSRSVLLFTSKPDTQRYPKIGPNYIPSSIHTLTIYLDTCFSFY